MVENETKHEDEKNFSKQIVLVKNKNRIVVDGSFVLSLPKDTPPPDKGRASINILSTQKLSFSQRFSNGEIRPDTKQSLDPVTYRTFSIRGNGALLIDDKYEITWVNESKSSNLRVFEIRSNDALNTLETGFKERYNKYIS